MNEFIKPKNEHDDDTTNETPKWKNCFNVKNLPCGEVSGTLAKFVNSTAHIGPDGIEVKESIDNTFDLGQKSPPLPMKNQLALLFRLLKKANPTTNPGQEEVPGQKCPYYTAIFTCTNEPMFVLGQVLAQVGFIFKNHSLNKLI